MYFSFTYSEIAVCLNYLYDSGVMRDTVVFNAIISAVQNAARERLAEELMIPSDVELHKQLVGGIEEYGAQYPSNRWRTERLSEPMFVLARKLYQQGVIEGRLPPLVPLDSNFIYSNNETIAGIDTNTTDTSNNKNDANGSAISNVPVTVPKSRSNPTNTVDFHGVSRAVAQTALSLVLEDMKTGRRKPFDLYIITGKGTHKNSSGERGVLRKELQMFLLGLEPKGILKVTSVNDNSGLMVLPLEDIERWIAVGKES